MKRTLAIVLVMLILASSCVIPAYANSAQTHWRGVDSTGAMVVGENCPIEVKKEVLSFDISEFPSNYYREKEDFLAYTGKVTAEYTFYNPTDLTVTATLAFPFGKQPDYASIYDEESQSYVTNVDTEKYDITVNGETIEKNIRYTLKSDLQFDLSTDLPKLNDSYISDSFFSPTMTVTKYTYIIGGANKEGLIDKDKYHAANVAFDWNGGDGKTRIYFPEQSGFHTQKDGDGRMSMWADNGDVFSVYAIGQPLSTPLVMKCYEDGGVEDKEEISGTVTLTKTETMTLEELALENWRESTGVSKVDWYNAVIDAFNYGAKDNPKYNYVSLNVVSSLSTEIFMGALMRWYEYEITIAPKESIVNTVTAPIYPAIDMNYDPNIFSYTYLLSPASTWASFGELEVIINTPFFITENSLDGFTKTEAGYTLKRNGLPSGELEFTLCTSENPTKPIKPITDYIPIEIIISFSVIGGVILLVGGGIVALVIIRKKKKAKKTEEQDGE